MKICIFKSKTKDFLKRIICQEINAVMDFKHDEEDEEQRGAVIQIS